MILSDAEIARIERNAAWFGEVSLLIQSHRELASTLQDLVHIRYGEMTLNARLKELLDKQSPER